VSALISVAIIGRCYGLKDVEEEEEEEEE